MKRPKQSLLMTITVNTTGITTLRRMLRIQSKKRRKRKSRRQARERRTKARRKRVRKPKVR